MGIDVLSIIERCIAIVLLVLLLPLFFMISIIIKINLKGSVIFKQKRMGQYGKEFVIYKFRTLLADAPDNIPTDDIQDYSQYSTKIGLLLRSTSLDELPQILNIIKGDMSFVGPRPVMLNEYQLNKSRLELGIYNVKPGITGWSQINGRDVLNVNEKVKFDLDYINRKSTLFDLYIIYKTIFKVAKRENIKRRS